MLLGHRYYDPSTGRFLTRDPAQDGRNWYTYVENNATKLVDPDGLYRVRLYFREVRGGPIRQLGYHGVLVIEDNGNYWTFEGNGFLGSKLKGLPIRRFGSAQKFAQAENWEVRVDLIDTGSESSKKIRRRIARVMRLIDALDLNYRPIGGLNSNSYVHALVRITFGLQDFLDQGRFERREQYFLPGWKYLIKVN